DGGSQSSQAGDFGENDWRETIVKVSINLAGLQNDLALQTYLNFGKNVKFPTLFQQISLADDAENLQARLGAQTILAPEKNNSIEIGAKLSRQIYGQPAFYGWRIDALYFQNHYDNKIVTVANVTSPVASYFSVPDARITGVEIKPSVYMYKKKATFEIGLSKYWISDKQAFPFKSDIKRTLSVIIDHAGYNFQALWFKEGEQVGKLRQLDGTPVEVILPDYSNLDLHLSKTFSISKIKLFLNVSGRNLLKSDDVVLEGIALRDRRYYITIGSQI
ncbi:MAG: TonB-dependent receptor domain-containing protein, partial [bacterium]